MKKAFTTRKKSGEKSCQLLWLYLKLDLCCFGLIRSFSDGWLEIIWEEKPQGAYDEEKIAEAVEKIPCKVWKYERGSNEADTPIGTFASRISRNSNGCVGHLTALNTNEDKYLVDLVLILQSYVESSTTEDVLKYASVFVSIMNLAAHLKDDQRRRQWYCVFYYTMKN